MVTQELEAQCGSAVALPVDDARIMLLLCILHDATEWDFKITDACPDCRSREATCPAHWDEHESRRARYFALIAHVESHKASDEGIIRQLASAQVHIFVEALTAAVNYREGQKAPEDAALQTAYRALKFQICQTGRGRLGRRAVPGDRPAWGSNGGEALH